MKSLSRLLLLPLLPLAAFVTGTFFAPSAQRIEGFDQPPPGTTPCNGPGEGCGTRVEVLCMPRVLSCHCEGGACAAQVNPATVGVLNPNGHKCLISVPWVCGVRWACTSNQFEGGCQSDAHCVSGQGVMVPGETFQETGDACSRPLP